MKLAFCIDDKGGMLFGTRRVSRDRTLIADLAELVCDEALYIEPYSEELFSEVELNLILSESPAEKADESDYAFIESSDPKEYISSAEELIIYRWNRSYPSTLRFTAMPEKEGFALVESCDFKGNSHDKITREIYKRK